MTRVAFLLPHLRAGGAERAVINWLAALDRAHFTPLLMLGRVEGGFLDLLTPDVAPIAIGGGRALTRPLRIARLLAEHRVDVAYSATSAMNLALLAAPTRARRIVSEHTPPDAYLAEAKWPAARRLAMRLLYPRAAAMAVPTDVIGTALARVAPGARCVTIPNPVLAGSPAPLPPLAPGPVLRLAAAGRLVPAKGIDLLIEAAARLPAALDWRLAIHGEGPERAALAALVTARGLADRVTLAGHAADLPARLAEADLLVMPSRREGFGNVAVEAMAVGTPVLATRAGGVETFVEDGVSGFLCAPGDADALAAAIVYAADPARRAAVRGRARDVAARFTVGASTRRLAALIEQAAS